MTTKQMPEEKPIEGVFGIYKRTGETPLQCLDRLRSERPEYIDQTLSYAGRLDPLASGVLLVLSGDEANKKRKEFLGLPKTYEIEVLFGFSTDTYDVLGLIQESKSYDPKDISQKVSEISKDISNFDEMEYPPYSSKPVDGKSLFQWAREGKIDEISVPKQQGKVRTIEILKTRQESTYDIKEKIFSLISSVSGDFRQEEIAAKWKDQFEKGDVKEVLIIKLRIECESGVYMRSLAHRLGQLSGVPALALNIIRTKVGNFDIDSSLI